MIVSHKHTDTHTHTHTHTIPRTKSTVIPSLLDGNHHANTTTDRERNKEDRESVYVCKKSRVGVF